MASDECVIDVWNYFNRNCTTGWVRAKSLDIVGDCGAEEVNCTDFVSNYTMVGQYFNSSAQLAVGKFCVVKVDATVETARVIFDDVSKLGVEVDGYQAGDVITVEGETRAITIYNGADSGQLTFTISFSGAYSALSSIAVAASAIAMVNMF